MSPTRRDPVYTDDQMLRIPFPIRRLQPGKFCRIGDYDGMYLIARVTHEQRAEIMYGGAEISAVTMPTKVDVRFEWVPGGDHEGLVSFAFPTGGQRVVVFDGQPWTVWDVEVVHHLSGGAPFVITLELERAEWMDGAVAAGGTVDG